MAIRKYGGRSWAVYDTAGALVCVCLYKKGAQEVVRRLAGRLEAGSEAEMRYCKLV